MGSLPVERVGGKREEEATQNSGSPAAVPGYHLRDGQKRLRYPFKGSGYLFLCERLFKEIHSNVTIPITE